MADLFNVTGGKAVTASMMSPETITPKVDKAAVSSFGSVEAKAPGFVGYRIRVGVATIDTEMWANTVGEPLRLAASQLPLTLVPHAPANITVEPHPAHGGNTTIGGDEQFTITVAELEEM
ncbi:MAG: hypothetical protein ACYTGZ_12355 [Planctomycetota bacterium]|jgi:hypothetical protein